MFLLTLISPLAGANITVKQFTEIQSEGSDIAPCITPDGRYIVFQSNRGYEDAGYSIYETFRGKSNQWSSPHKIVFDDYSTFEGLPYFSGTDGWIYLTVVSNSNYKKGNARAKEDIWVSRRIKGGWLSSKRLDAPVNSEYSETSPWLSFNGNTMYFSSDRPGGQGGFDIWYSTRVGTTWSAPRNMGPLINSPANEVYPRVHSDDKVFYYSSDRPGGRGGQDIYVSRRKKKGWSKGLNAGPEINTSTNEFLNSVPATARFLLLSRGKKFEEKIFWVSPVPSLLTPTPTSLVRFIVIDAENNKPVKFNLEIQQNITKEIIFDRDYAPYDYKAYKEGDAEELDESNAASYFNKLGLVVPLKAPGNYSLHLTAQGYFFSEQPLLISRAQEDEVVQVIKLNKLKVGAVAALRSINFKPRTAKPSKDSFAALKRLVQFLKRHPTVVLEISGHTDNRGGVSYNLKLSRKRAAAIAKYLKKKGISGTRLTTVGHGQSKPVAANDTDANRARNRRVEFRILKI